MSFVRRAAMQVSRRAGRSVRRFGSGADPRSFNENSFNKVNVGVVLGGLTVAGMVATKFVVWVQMTKGGFYDNPVGYTP